MPKLNKWIIEKTKDRNYWFGTESSASDPRLQSEDLGEIKWKLMSCGIKNLKIVMKNLGDWSKEPNTDYENLRTMHAEVNNQFRRYIGHVAKWIGGVYQESKKVEEEGDVYTIVEKEKQVEAMDFLVRNLFAEAPIWLIPQEYMNKFVSRPELFIERAYFNSLRFTVKQESRVKSC